MKHKVKSLPVDNSVDIIVSEKKDVMTEGEKKAFLMREKRNKNGKVGSTSMIVDPYGIKLSIHEIRFCDAYVFGRHEIAGRAVRCLKEVCGEEWCAKYSEGTLWTYANDIMARDRVKEAIKARVDAITTPQAIKTYIARELANLPDGSSATRLRAGELLARISGMLTEKTEVNVNLGTVQVLND